MLKKLIKRTRREQTISITKVKIFLMSIVSNIIISNVVTNKNESIDEKRVLKKFRIDIDFELNEKLILLFKRQ